MGEKNQHIFFVVFVALVGMYCFSIGAGYKDYFVLKLGLSYIVLSVFLFQLKNWARIATISLSILSLLFVCLPSLVLAIMFDPFYGVAALFYSPIAVLAIMSMDDLNRPEIRASFKGSVGIRTFFGLASDEIYIFWRSYFYFLLLFALPNSLPKFPDSFGHIQGVKITDLFLSILAMSGLFAFSWQKKLFNQVFWKCFFFIFLFWNVFYLFKIFPGEEAANGRFGIISRIVYEFLTWVRFAALFVALFLYGAGKSNKNQQE